MKVILALDLREAELAAYENDLPPRSRDVILIATDKGSGLNRLRGLMLTREDVIEVDGAPRGRYYTAYKRQLEAAFYDA